MAVHQNRAHFRQAHGGFVDRPAVGRDLTAGYWEPGNGEMFLDLVQRVSGEPLTARAWVQDLRQVRLCVLRLRAATTSLATPTCL